MVVAVVVVAVASATLTTQSVRWTYELKFCFPAVVLGETLYKVQLLMLLLKAKKMQFELLVHTSAHRASCVGACDNFTEDASHNLNYHLVRMCWIA